MINCFLNNKMIPKLHHLWFHVLLCIRGETNPFLGALFFQGNPRYALYFHRAIPRDYLAISGTGFCHQHWLLLSLPKLYSLVVEGKVRFKAIEPFHRLVMYSIS